MNVFNRLLVILLILLAIVLTIVIVIVPRQTAQLGEQAFRGMGQFTTAWETGNWPMFASGRVIIGGALLLLCLALLWLELRRPRKKTIRVQKAAGGEAYIAIDSIAQRLAYNIDQLPDVVRVSPRVTGRSKGVDVDLLIETSPDIDVPMKTEEVLQVTKEVVEDRMGLKLGKVQVKIKHAPYPKE
jgi:preprotein translocase subunit SecG